MLGALGTLIGDVAPTVTADYATGHLNIIAILLAMMSQEQDRTVENHVADIKEMRGLFAEAAAHLKGTGLGREAADAAKDSELPLRASQLAPTTDQAKGLLIKLHAVIEETDTPWADEFKERIWAHLKATAKRHAIAPPQLG